MALQVEPNKKYPLTWQVPDSTDSATYYVRAYISEIASDGTKTELETVNLTDNSDQTFYYNYEMPADTSGQGRAIIIEYKAFSDSGYTTEATTLYRSMEMFLVKQTWGSHLQSGGASASAIREIVREELKGRKHRKIKFPDQKETDLMPVLESIKGIKIPEIPESKEVDLSPVYRWIGRLEMKIEEFEKAIPSVLTAIKSLNMDNEKKWLTEDSETNRKMLKEFEKEIKSIKSEFSKRVFMGVNLKDELVQKEKKENPNQERRKYY